MHNREYIQALENLIMDELLPMYLVGCRSVGRDPKSNQILVKLLKTKKLKKEVPWLLTKNLLS